MFARRYETLILITPDLTPEELEQAKSKITDVVEKMEGKILRFEDWGNRQLAYPVKRQLRGHYLLLEFMGQPDLLNEVERQMRLDERFWKFLTLVKDKRFDEAKYLEELERLSAERAKREADALNGGPGSDEEDEDSLDDEGDDSDLDDDDDGSDADDDSDD